MIVVLEDDYNYLNRIEKYAKRRWEEPLLCTYLWDKYDLDASLENRQKFICRCDFDYAYDDDYNLKIIISCNTFSPFVDQIFRASSKAYDESGFLEDGHLVFYIRYDESDDFRLYGESPISFKIGEKKDFEIVVKYYNITSYANSINPDDEINISDVTKIHVRDYTDADYFVSNQGDDTNDGSYNNPFRTLQHASDKIIPGETICILTDLELETSVLFYSDCNIITKNKNRITSNGWFFSIYPNTNLYIQNLMFNTTYTVFNYTGSSISNYGDTLITIESKDAIIPKLDLDLVSKDYWISGETINIDIIGNLENKTIYILNSLNECVYSGVAQDNFKYTVPQGLDHDTLSIVVMDYNYMFSKSFDIYNIDADWYVDTQNGEDYINDGRSLNTAFRSLEWAIYNVTPSFNRIFFRGLETVDDLEVPYLTIIKGIKNDSIIRCFSDSYFSVDNYLSINDLLLNSCLVDSVSFDNKGSFPLKVCNFDHEVGRVLFVDGLNGDDGNSGDSWGNAFRTLSHALMVEGSMIYFSGGNSISSPLDVHQYTEIIGTMNQNQLYNSNDSYFKISRDQVLKLSNIILKYDTQSHLIENNTYMNNGTASMEIICSPIIPPKTSYKLELISNDDWINGETVNITLELKSGTFPSDRTIEVYNSQDILISSLSKPGTFEYRVPDDLTEDTITAKVIEDSYSCSRTFKIYKPSYELELVSDDEWVSGETVNISLELKSGTFPSSRTIDIYNSQDILITTLSNPGTFQYKVPNDLTEDIITAKVIQDSYTCSKTFKINKTSYELELISNDEWINGETVNITLELKSGTFPSDRTIEVYNSQDILISSLSIPGTFEYVVPDDLTEDTITAKVTKDSYSCSKTFKIYKPSYELELISNDEWISGETVSISLELKSGSFPSERTIDIYNSQDILITTLSQLGTFKYKVPDDLTEDTITAKVIKDSYTCSKTFKINKSSYELELVSDDDWVSGETVNITLELKSGTFPSDRTIEVYNSHSVLITTLSQLGTFKYGVPNDLTEDTITAKVIQDSYTCSKTFKIIKPTGNDWYVDPANGNDNNTGRSLNDAFKTLEHAITQVTTNENIIHLNGSETIASITISKDVTIDGLEYKGILESNDSYFNIETGHTLELSNITLKYDNQSHLIEHNTYANNSTASMEITCSNIIPPKTNYELELGSDDEWVNGKTVNISLELKSGTFPSNRTIDIYNSQSILITTLSELGTFEYRVPEDLTEDTITVNILEDTYTCSKTFKINKPTYELELVSDDEWVSGGTVSISLELKSGTFPSSRTIEVYNSQSKLITSLSNPGTFQYQVPNNLTEDTITAKVIQDSYSCSKTFKINKPAENDWYVDPVDGDDNNSGKSLDNAFKTLEHAITQVTTNENIIHLLGTETIASIPISKDVIIDGLEYKGILNSNDSYFNIGAGHTLELSKIILKYDAQSHSIENNTYVNNGTASMEVTCSNIIPPKTSYELELVSDDEWVSGETVNITLGLKSGSFPSNRTIDIYNSHSILITTLSELGTFEYKVPDDLTEDTITVNIVEDTYSCSKTFKINKPTYELELVSDDTWISGETVNISLELKSGTFPSDRTIEVYNSQNLLISSLSNLGTFQYQVPNDLTEDTITAKVIKDSYTCSKTFKINKPTGTDWYVNPVDGDDNNSGKSLNDAFKTLEHAITQVTTNENIIHLIGTETIASITISKDMTIDGLEYQGILDSNDSYFNIDKGHSLKLGNIVLKDQKILNNTYTNTNSAKLEVII